MFRKKNIVLACFALNLSFFSCKKDDDQKPELQIPGTYDATNFEANTPTQAGVLARLKVLVDSVKKGRNNANQLNYNTLLDLFNAGNPSLSSLNSNYYKEKLTGTEGWLKAAADASKGTYTPAAPDDTDEGGTFGGYLFDENGLEPEQIIEKGMFGAVLFNHANQLLKENLTAQKVDQVIAITGSNPTFPNTNTASKTAKPDGFFATYIARRDKNDGAGFYSILKSNYIKLQAALKAEDDFTKEANEAKAAILSTLEMTNAATIINYCHSVRTTMSKTSPTDSEKGSALHALSEAIGFLHGYRMLDAGFTKITIAQIDQNLELMNAPYNGTPTCYKFVTVPETQLDRLLQVINNLKSIYGFSDQQIEDFRKNWITEQGR
jgi:hypothetical protein